MSRDATGSAPLFPFPFLFSRFYSFTQSPTRGSARLGQIPCGCATPRQTASPSRPAAARPCPSHGGSSNSGGLVDRLVRRTQFFFGGMDMDRLLDARRGRGACARRRRCAVRGSGAHGCRWTGESLVAAARNGGHGTGRSYHVPRFPYGHATTLLRALRWTAHQSLLLLAGGGAGSLPCRARRRNGRAGRPGARPRRWRARARGEERR